MHITHYRGYTRKAVLPRSQVFNHTCNYCASVAGTLGKTVGVNLTCPDGTIRRNVQKYVEIVRKCDCISSAFNG